MKRRVLMIAYACNPRGTGEHWLGWGWAEQASRNFEVDLITTPKSRAAVEESSRALGITPHFVEIPSWLRRFTELTGSGWLRKLAWQKRAGRLAAALQAEKRFLVVHQTTFHSFRIPFLAAGLGVPSVWGPIAGGEHVPRGFERYLGGTRVVEFGRAQLNRAWLEYPPVQRSLKQASVLFVSNRTTLGFLPAAVRPKCRVVPPNALRIQDEQWSARAVGRGTDRENGLRLLYVGNCVATRAIPMVFEALCQSGLSNYGFTIVGGGPALEGWRNQAAEMGLGERVKFSGKVPYDELNSYYAAADVLVFPALRDSGGSALLEAMARYVPVICLDWAGPGEMVDENSGIKVPVSTPEAAVKAFAAGLVRLWENPEDRARLAAAARARAEAIFRWETKRELLEATYEGLLTR